MVNDEFMQEDIDDEKTVAYIRQHLPQDLRESFTDDQLYYMIDTLADYYSESGCLDAEPDEEGYVDIDIDEIAAHLSREARKDGIGDFAPDDLYFVVVSELESCGVIDPEE